MNYIVLLEGHDNIGKSTYLKQEFNRLDMSYTTTLEHFTGPGKGKSSEQYARQKKKAYKWLRKIIDIDKKLQDKDETIITLCDRSIFGEYVYSRLRNVAFDYLPKILQVISKLKNTKLLFFIIYSNKYTFLYFTSLKNKDDLIKHYDTIQTAEEISNRFLELSIKLAGNKNLKTLVINSNNYFTISDRNSYISERIDYFIKDYVYQYKIMLNCYQIPYRPKENVYYRKEFYKSSLDCPEFSQCAIGIDHAKYTECGKIYNSPVSGSGSVQNTKYIFVGDFPRKHGAASTGIPFYGDSYENLFRTTLDKLDISLLSVYFTHILKCCPEGNDLNQHLPEEDENPVLDYACVRGHLKVEIKSILKRSKNCKVFAVGNLASNTLAVLGIECKEIKQPQDFEYRDINMNYTNYLEDLLG